MCPVTSEQDTESHLVSSSRPLNLSNGPRSDPVLTPECEEWTTPTTNIVDSSTCMNADGVFLSFYVCVCVFSFILVKKKVEFIEEQAGKWGYGLNCRFE